MKMRKGGPALMSRPLSRRTILRGMTAAIALPALEAMWPRSAHGQVAMTPNSRFLAFYVPNGIHMPAWTPDEVGENFGLKPILEPVSAFKDQMLLLSGLRNDPAKPDGPGDHAGGTGAFLTATHLNKSESILGNGVSIDQLIASQVGQNHRFPSLVLGAEGGGNAGGCDSGYSCAYSRNISWVNGTTPAARETSPLAVFNRLFGSRDAGASAERIRKERLYKRSILDFVRGDTDRLKAKLGAADNRKLDEYLSGIRELERQIQLSEVQACDPPDVPEAPMDYRDTITQMLDLTVLAFQCDLSPVVSFMLGNGGSNRAFPFLDIAEGHHQISHHQDIPENFERLQKIDIWEIQQLAYLLDKLSKSTEGDSTILDKSIVFFSSEIEDGNSHAHSNLPIALFGGANGQIQGNRHLKFGTDRRSGPPIADLFIRLAQLCGAQVEQFGDDGTQALNLS